jgi:hypothetical protein
VTESGREGAGVLSVRESVSVLDGWTGLTKYVAKGQARPSLKNQWVRLSRLRGGHLHHNHIARDRPVID